MALLQPQRETYNLFDDVLLLADGESLPCRVQVLLCSRVDCQLSQALTFPTGYPYTSRQKVAVEQHHCMHHSLLNTDTGPCVLQASSLIIQWLNQWLFTDCKKDQATRRHKCLCAAGCLVYHGPREQVVPFFESLGFKLPPRKGTADFLQEITSQKDQAVSSGTLHASTWLNLHDHVCLTQAT